MNAREKEQVILAVESLGGSVTVQQVAQSTGLAANLVFRCLREVAAATGSTLLVSDDGEILFRFPANFIDLYQSKDRAIWVDESLRAALDIGYFGLRIVFGLTLLYTIYLFHPTAWPLLIIYLVLIFGGLYFEFSAGDEESPVHVHVHLSEHKKLLTRALGLPGLRRLFSFKYRQKKHELKYLLADLRQPPPPIVPHASVFNICFSYVFGDGNPGLQNEELKWQVLAEVIRRQNGAVILDQLAPYMCCAPDDEEAILPVLQRFNGLPVATESGNLVYLFPDLVRVKVHDENLYIPYHLNENTWRFSDLPFPQILPVWVISTALLCLSFYGFYHPDSPVVSSFWFDNPGAEIWQFIFVFAVFFFVVPGLRFIFITINNGEIEERNKLRRYFADLLDRPDPVTFQKLFERKQYELDESANLSRFQGNVQSLDEYVIYTTQKTLDEQGLD